MRRRSGWIWGGRIAAVVVVAGLGAYLASVGLDKADKLASVLGCWSRWPLWSRRTSCRPQMEDHSESALAQQVANTMVGGHLTQVRDAKDVRVHGPVTAGRRRLPRRAGPVPEGQSGQYVNGVWVGGNLTQVDGADGDITIG